MSELDPKNKTDSLSSSRFFLKESTGDELERRVRAVFMNLKTELKKVPRSSTKEQQVDLCKLGRGNNPSKGGQLSTIGLVLGIGK